MRRTLRILKIASIVLVCLSVSVVGLYLLLGYYGLPWAAKRYAPELTAQYLKRQGTIGALRFDPVDLRLEIDDLALKEADGRPLVGFKKLQLDLDVSSSLRGPITLTELRLDSPSVNVTANKDGKLNWLKLVDDLPKSEEPQPPEPEGAPTLVVVRQFAIVDGAVDYADEARALKEGLKPINLELHDFSTVPDQQGKYKLAATLNDGGKVDWEGSFGLAPLASEGDLKLNDLPLSVPWKYVKSMFRLNQPEGRLGFAGHYRFVQNAETMDLGLDKLTVNLAGLKLAQPDAPAPLLVLDKLAVSDLRFDLGAKTIDIPAVSLTKGAVVAEMDAKGVINWSTLSAPSAQLAGQPASAPAPPLKQAKAKPVATKEKPKAKGKGKNKPAGKHPATPKRGNGPDEPTSAQAATGGWKINIGAFTLADLSVRYADASRAKPYAVNIAGFGLDFKAAVDAGGSATWVKIDDLEARTGGIVLDSPETQQTWVELGGLRIERGGFDLVANQLKIGKVTLKGGATEVLREADGRLPLAEVFAAKPGAAPAPETPPPDQAAEQSRPFQATLDELALEGFKLGYTDKTFTPAVAYDADDITIALKRLGSDLSMPLDFNAKIKLRQGGTLSAIGSAVPNGSRADAAVKIDRVDLKALQAVVSRFARLNLLSADVSGDLKVTYLANEKGPVIKATGMAGLGNLLLDDASTKIRFLSWKSLALNNIDLGLNPDRARIKEVVFIEPGATVKVYADKSTNIASIFAQPGGKPVAAEAEAPAQPKATTVARPVKVAARIDPPPPAKPADKSSGDFPFNIERVRLERGLLDYSDASLVIPFETHIRDFRGGITDISSSPKDRTTLKLEGNIDDYGSLKVDGSLSPLQIKTYSNVKAVFRNVAMNSLSPYSATFAGRRIQSGKLDLDLAYQVQEGKLKSANRMVLKEFTLGETVESPGATQLPLDLAVALLTDSEGKIDAELEAEGDVNNPEFAVGKLIWKTLANLITRAVTAPFRALGSMFGDSDKGGAALLFEPGNYRIPSPEQEKLIKLADSMGSKSGVKVTVHGGFDPEVDGLALRELRVRQAIARELGSTVGPDEDPGPLAFTNAETQNVLEEAVTTKIGPNGADQAATEFEQAQARKPQRIGPMAALGRASPDSDFYEFLFKKLVDAQPLPQAEIDTLAQRRAETVAKILAARPGFNPARAVAGEAKKVSADKEGVPTALELGAK